MTSTQIPFRVTPLHLSRGRRCDPNFCPVALALHEALPLGRAFHVAGTGWVSYIDHDGDIRTGHLDTVSLERVHQIDALCNVEPWDGSITLRPTYQKEYRDAHRIHS